MRKPGPGIVQAVDGSPKIGGGRELRPLTVITRILSFVLLVHLAVVGLWPRGDWRAGSDSFGLEATAFVTDGDVGLAIRLGPNYGGPAGRTGDPVLTVTTDHSGSGELILFVDQTQVGSATLNDTSSDLDQISKRRLTFEVPPTRLESRVGPLNDADRIPLNVSAALLTSSVRVLSFTNTEGVSLSFVAGAPPLWRSDGDHGRPQSVVCGHVRRFTPTQRRAAQSS